jgi:phosphomethylpyrimidine synthase
MVLAAAGHDPMSIKRGIDKAVEAGVQTIVEGPGHIPLDEIEANVILQKRLTNRKPFYMLGPLVTDIAPGYDHVAAAIGGAVACMDGADFLCMVSPSEHLASPASKRSRKGPGCAGSRPTWAIPSGAPAGDWSERELAMALARRDLDWEKQFETALYGDVARRIHCRDGDLETCSMCGDLCAIKVVRELFEEKKKKKI